MPRIKTKTCLDINCNDISCNSVNLFDEVVNTDDNAENEIVNTKDNLINNNDNEKYRICKDINCNKRCSFNFKNKKPIYCNDHKKEGMINVISKKCLECTKRAYFNNENEIEPIYCNEHKKENMINIQSKKCLNCDKQPSYNYKNEKRPIYCSNHKLENMINIQSKKCLECNKQPSYNYENEKRLIYCNEHKKENMINIKNKKCLKCNKQPSYNYENKKEGIYCNDHKKENMINVKSKKCLDCNKRSSFNYENEIEPIYCNEHKKENMVNVQVKKCLDCNKQPSYNYENKQVAIYCNEHKKENMINILNKKCIECNIVIANPKYKNHCTRCFIYKFPDEPVSHNYKIKEKHVTDFIKDSFKDINCVFDKQIQGGCSKKRPDIFIDLFTHSIIIEVDEDQHIDYSCENKRIMELFIDLANRPIVIIRFNPDSYLDENNKKIQSCFKYHKTRGIPIISNEEIWNSRLELLKSTIIKYINTIPIKEVTIEKLFYNNI